MHTVTQQPDNIPPDPIHLRIPWSKPGDWNPDGTRVQDHEYWYVQTYEGHHSEGPAFAIDFYHSAPGLCSWGDGDEARSKYIRAAHSGTVRLFEGCCDYDSNNRAIINCEVLTTMPQRVRERQYTTVQISGTDQADQRVITWYVHLTPDPGLRDGARVVAGDVIGSNSDNGCALTGPHLHFQVFRGIPGNAIPQRFDNGDVLLDGEIPLDNAASCSAPYRFKPMPRLSISTPGGALDGVPAPSCAGTGVAQSVVLSLVGLTLVSARRRYHGRHSS